MKFYSFTLFAAFAVFALTACGKKAQAEGFCGSSSRHCCGKTEGRAFYV